MQAEVRNSTRKYLLEDAPVSIVASDGGTFHLWNANVRIHPNDLHLVNFPQIPIAYFFFNVIVNSTPLFSSDLQIILPFNLEVIIL